MKHMFLIIAALLAIPSLTPVAADEAVKADEAGWAALAEPGAVGLMRHALAPGTGDPAGFEIGRCATQRNLDDRGRAQARATGAAIRARQITFDLVLASAWCRSRETAELMDVGPVETFEAINSFFGNRGAAAAQTSATRALLRDLPADGRALLVTHQVNISALTGQGARSGEIIVIRMDAQGNLTVTGEILIDP